MSKLNVCKFPTFTATTPAVIDDYGLMEVDVRDSDTRDTPFVESALGKNPHISRTFKAVGEPLARALIEGKARLCQTEKELFCAHPSDLVDGTPPWPAASAFVPGTKLRVSPKGMPPDWPGHGREDSEGFVAVTVVAGRFDNEALHKVSAKFRFMKSFHVDGVEGTARSVAFTYEFRPRREPSFVWDCTKAYTVDGKLAFYEPNGHYTMGTGKAIPLGDKVPVEVPIPTSEQFPEGSFWTFDSTKNKMAPEMANNLQDGELVTVACVSAFTGALMVHSKARPEVDAWVSPDSLSPALPRPEWTFFGVLDLDRVLREAAEAKLDAFVLDCHVTQERLFITADLKNRFDKVNPVNPIFDTVQTRNKNWMEVVFPSDLTTPEYPSLLKDCILDSVRDNKPLKTSFTVIGSRV